MDAFFLGFDGDELGVGKSPGGGHSDGADAAAKIEDGGGGWTPACAVPGSEYVVGGEAMAAFELEYSEVAAEGIDGFAVCGFDVLDVIDIWERTGDGPATE